MGPATLAKELGVRNRRSNLHRTQAVPNIDKTFTISIDTMFLLALRYFSL